MILKHHRIFDGGLAGFHADGAAVRVRSGSSVDGGALNRTDEWKVAYTCTSRFGAPDPILPALSMATASCGLIVPSAT